ncbi:MAG TPA: RidA family protein [Candidatus Dormibacteraeota bacterium]
MVENFNPPALGPAVGFSHASRAGGFVFLGGQVGSDESGHVVDPTDLARQFARAIQNVSTALEAAGSSPGQAVKLTYYVTDVGAYRRSLKAIGAAYREVFGKHFPATSLFGVKELFDPDALVEIECVALVGTA